MGLKLLLADPDEKWLVAAQKFLSGHAYDVEVCANGRDAQIAVSKEEHFAYIFNWDLKNHNPIQVLKFIKAQQKRGKFFLVVADKEKFLDGGDPMPKLKKMGVFDVIYKPFTMEEMLAVIEGEQGLKELMGQLQTRDGVSNEEDVARPDDDFTKIPIAHFFSPKNVLFDVFVRLASGKFVKILHAGDKFDNERIKKYKEEKGVEFLYFARKDRKKFLMLQNQFAKKAVNSAKLDSKIKASLIKDTVEKFVEELYDSGLKPHTLDQGKEICNNVYSLVEKDQNLFKLLKSLDEFDPSAFTHAYLTTLFSSAIVKQFEWQSQLTIETISMAAMFHDIGKLKMPKELIAKRPGDMNEEELEQYHKHCEYGIEVLEGNHMVPRSVTQIIAQHHENSDGTGFPAGLKDFKIFTLAKIVHLADEFAHMLVDEEIKPVEALKKILMNPALAKRYNGFVLEHFCQVFVSPGKIKKESGALQSNSKMVPTKKAI